MSEAKNRKARFLAANPLCCFCGGSASATTVDHVPSRGCFPDRHGPDGFEFPACADCQSATRLDELAFALYVRMADPDDATFSQRDLERLLTGVGNNLPHLLPKIDLTSRQKRASLRELGLEKPRGVFAADLPFAAIPAAVHRHIERYARKIACALFYREMGRPAGATHEVWAIWGQGADRTRMDAWSEFRRITPMVVLGQRRNFDFGDRFGYRCNKTEPPQSDVFAVIAQFGAGLAILAAIVHEGAKLRKDDQDWVPITQMFD